jgi:hypothetical protein
MPMSARPPAGEPRTDFLLLNASNFERNVIYPYAFVQVRALARAHGLRVATHDLLGVPVERYGQVVARLLERHRPRLVGITMRQADSIVHAEYACAGWKGYFPLENTASLLREVRERSDIPVVMGGFGFTTHALALYQRLGPDYGVQGEADGLFARFGDVVARRDCTGVGNLIHRSGGEVNVNARVFGDPLPDREYDDEVVDQLEAFYGRPWLYGEKPPSVAVELGRGCIFRCEFCTEPRVKGRTFRVRDLDAVMGDVEFLARRGIRRIFLVCSEINMGSVDLALEVAERFARMNEQPWSPGVRWHAYHLPRWMSRDDLRTLDRSGFAGGWNDFPSFEDRNLTALRVPYRTAHVLEHMRRTLDVQGGSDAFGNPPHVSLFIGNSHATPQTVARSLRAFDETGMANEVEDVKVFFGTRLFAPEDGSRVQAPANAVTYTSGGTLDQVDVLHPTFYLAPAIEALLGPSAERHREFFDYVTTTLMSRIHEARLDWAHFLATAATPAELAAWLAPHRRRPLRAGALAAPVQELVTGIVACDTGGAIRAFLTDPTLAGPLRQRAARAVVALATRPLPGRWAEILAKLELEHDAAGNVMGSSFRVLTTLLARFDTAAALLEHVRATFGLAADARELWLLRRLLFEKNVVLRAEYRPLLVVDEDAPADAPQRSRAGGLAAEPVAA